MTLLRLIQRASILTGMTLASLTVHSNPAHAEPEYCIIASNGKTVCGKGTAIERMCVTTDGSNTICGKFKSATEGQAQRQETSKPSQGIVARKEVDNFVYTLQGCQRVDTSVRCQIEMVNKGKERRVSMYAPKSALVDANGKSHPGYAADLGGGVSGLAEATMSSGDNISIAITFDKVQEQIGKAQLLNVVFTGIKPVQFRNVPISN